MSGKQLGFGAYELATARKRTNRERFLGPMQAVVPWKTLIDLINPYYPKTGSKDGRPPCPDRADCICGCVGIVKSEATSVVVGW